MNSSENNITNAIIEVSVEDIIPNRFQPRLAFDEKALKDLAESIKIHGIIQPLVLRRLNDKFEIIAGERRYKAACMAGLTKVPAIIKEIDDNKSAEIAVVENLQRKNLTAIEEAQSYKKILDKGYITQEELAARMGVSQPTIANKLRLLNLSQEVQDALLGNKISERHARSLLAITDQNIQVQMLRRIISERLTVRQTDEEISKLLGRPINNSTPVEEKNNIYDTPNTNDSPTFEVPVTQPNTDINSNVTNTSTFENTSLNDNIFNVNTDEIKSHSEDIIKTPEPANIPIFCPFPHVKRESMLFTPTLKTSSISPRFKADIGGLIIGTCACVFKFPLSSSGAPSGLITLPSSPLPTGICNPSLAIITLSPLLKPSVKLNGLILKISLCVAITMPSVRVSLLRISHTTSPTLGDRPVALIIFVSTDIISPKFGERFLVIQSFCLRLIILGIFNSARFCESVILLIFSSIFAP